MVSKYSLASTSAVRDNLLKEAFEKKRKKKKAKAFAKVIRTAGNSTFVSDYFQVKRLTHFWCFSEYLGQLDGVCEIESK